MAAVGTQPMQANTMASGAAISSIPTLRVIVDGDFDVGCTVKVCGNAPELGDWNADKAPVTNFDTHNKRWIALVPLTSRAAALRGAGDLHRVEYKLCMKKAGSTGWEWQPGPNRIADLTSQGQATAGINTKGIHTPLNAQAPSSSGAGSSKGAEGTTTAESAASTVTTVREAWYIHRDGTGCITHPYEGDPYLTDHAGHLKHRYHLYEQGLAAIEAVAKADTATYKGEGSGLEVFSRSYEQYGFNRKIVNGQAGILYKEWAPGAQAASLIGDFNGWNHSATPCTRDPFGNWSVFLPDTPEGREAIPHDSWLKLSLVLGDGSRVTRVPAWIRYAVLDPQLNELVGKYWSPPPEARHEWMHPRPYTFEAADYSRIHGMPQLKSRSDWYGVVTPYEVETFGLHEEALAVPTGARQDSAPIRALRAAYLAQTQAASALAHTHSHKPSPTGDLKADPAHSGLRVYEAHVGMSSAEEKTASYRHFADNILPRIKSMGYNCVQLMAIMEHAYYGSFGYHVNQFLAPSSRFGTPEDLKYLVDKAHGMGLLIIMDCVHSHASKNVNDGLNRFDGTDHHYFHAGARGNHDLWDSRLFDYSKIETQRLLLSSLRLFVEEFRFDGYRFDGVTSMMYHHHGLSYGFSGDYNEYFGPNTDLSAVVYLMMANTLLHCMSPPVLSIAEDVSGMPTLGRPVWEGGVGFDYRLAMAVPDLWIKYLKEKSDEEWDLEQISWTLINRRWQEKCISYAESHDQALVGDKTLAFWLMDKEMYFHMSEALEPQRHPVVDRGIALHKMIRLLTYALGGEGWLNFMGNEFGHPEWIDFPREGNGWSYKYCRRQWNLVDDGTLLYKYMAAWDGGMHRLEDDFPWLKSRDSFVSTKHNGDKVLVFDRGTAAGPLVFAFNFHPTNSYTGYKIACSDAGDWEIALDSDGGEYGGYKRVDPSTTFHAHADGWNGRPASFMAYLPARTCVVFKKKGSPFKWMGE